MMTAVFYLRAFLCAMLILSTHGFPIKGSKSQDQSSGGSYTDSHSSNWERPGGHYSPMSYSPARDVPMVGPSSYQFETNPASGNLLSGTLPAGYAVGAGYVPVVPAQLGYADSAQPSPPETKWTVPSIFEKGLADNEALSSNDFSSSAELAPAAPSGPGLQSGETSSVKKEAEHGKFHGETEEVGYSAGPGFAMDSVGPWVYPNLYPYPLPHPYPQFDYRLLYGLYPPGTYSTFNKQHEKGKDYYQSIHYMKEHGPDTPGSHGSEQQKKIYPYGA
ncbi:uncharacterized protein LOC106513801 [Austrofundulus limnaeus]|uniref:Uncharacterized protein LOC106513801 n=1 Tax=Austrofundulus limnaeus TaxID=52670 RepID=A0A2I4ARX7_AUSLI|nr:PREDICTED: uncharacterized protein LOC106513801 [Austrofundulus limnaeus]XP_013858249.1 PREDICTED: uncharacterized protein LOC106513801 [Austrofundulus limnaeus]